MEAELSNKKNSVATCGNRYVVFLLVWLSAGLFVFALLVHAGHADLGGGGAGLRSCSLLCGRQNKIMLRLRTKSKINCTSYVNYEIKGDANKLEHDHNVPSIQRAN